MGVDGMGRALSPDSSVALYCVSKCLASVAAMRLIALGTLSPSDFVGDILADCAPGIASVSVGRLLSHSSGAYLPGPQQAFSLNRSDISRIARTAPVAEGVSESGPTLYSECAAWTVLEDCLAAVSGIPVMGLVESEVLDRLGLRDSFELGTEPSPRRRVGIGAVGGRKLPLLIENTAGLAFERVPGFGGFATLEGVVALVDAVRRELTGEGSPLGLGKGVTCETAPSTNPFNLAFRRHCRFAGGFARDLRSHGFGPWWSTESFGQSGLSGMLTVASDPLRGVSAALYMNGLSDGLESLKVREMAWKALLA